MKSTAGKLFLIPSALDDAAIHVVPEYVKQQIHSLDTFIVENEKSARQFLKKSGYPNSLNVLQLFALNEHTDLRDIIRFIQPILEGKNTGLISEAGCPGVADPGAAVVKAAHRHKITVVPLAGVSSVTLSLMASGLNGQSFSFAGYLPKERNARIKSLRELEKSALGKNETQIFIEAPYRNQHLLEDILQTCHPETFLCIACELTGPNEFVQTKSISDWKKQIPEINKRPCIFLIGK